MDYTLILLLAFVLYKLGHDVLMMRRGRKDRERSIKQKLTINPIKMNIEYDITKDVRYKQGKEQGIEQGIEKGDMKRAINVIVNMRDKGFEVAFISELVEEPVDFVTMILAQLKHRDSIFSLLKAGKEAEEIAETLNVSPWLVEVLKEDLDQ